ncbi:hypothetical protein V6N13_107370 [Hibiscus sabdariffa]|uniref:Uncharacterized protein n=1 Tax=Hibiscus sabdariffa TaxID=183260 RepID=A0ABR2SPX0_9ROSI
MQAMKKTDCTFTEHRSEFFDANGDDKDSGPHLRTQLGIVLHSSALQLLRSKRNELIFGNHFLTILFPVDRFSEMGPSSQTYFSNNRGRYSHRLKACRAASRGVLRKSWKLQYVEACWRG